MHPPPTAATAAPCIHPTLGTRRPRAAMVKAPTGGSTGASALARFKGSRSRARRANEATRHLLYLFPLPSSRLGRVTRAHSPLVGSPSRGSVTLCRKLAPIPAPELFQSTSGRGNAQSGVPRSCQEHCNRKERKAREGESPAEPSQSSSEKSKEKLTSN
ncbi:uncharacterized protein ACIB01_017040 [Guaruba guarouba]